MLTFDPEPKVAEQQMHAIIFSLTAFGYVDGDFAASEKEHIQEYVSTLVQQRARDTIGADLSRHEESLSQWTRHFHQVLERIDGEIQALFSESVSDGEGQMQFVLARLKLQAFEIFRRFDEEMRMALLEKVDELMHADGVVHDNEKKFRNELWALLNEPIELDELTIEPIADGAVVIDQTRQVPARSSDHPFLRQFEWNYASDPNAFAKQSEGDLRLMKKFLSELAEQRREGQGRLAKGNDFRHFADSKPFLDGHVYVVPPAAGTDCELLVLGDLHGCYSCLKAALLQVDFFAKVQAYHHDPAHNPNMIAVFLGDYIDRGRFSYNGVLRTLMQLYLSVPEHVFILRGNHEYYIEHEGRVYAPVQPSEAMSSLVDVAPTALFGEYMRLFDELPTAMAFDDIFLVHAGIPRDDTFAEKFQGLASLNDPDLRFQMLWSDPSPAEFIPLDLQRSTARFSFGTHQFKRFMSRIGCSTMIRGHERVVEGFRQIYDEPEAVLVSLFSAGGATNDDLPEDSNYREVTPKALTVRYHEGVSVLTPFLIEYEKFNDPRYNNFFQELLAANTP